MRQQGLVIESIEPDSIARELGLEPGDQILRVNDADVADILDYRFLTADENLHVLVQKQVQGEQWLLEIEKDYHQPLGINFAGGGWGQTRRCGNQCIFCFVDQMPPGMRETLYIKDDDYRLSFAQGNFITLTNVGDSELERIVRLRLSPLYLSIHTTNPTLRRKMMGNPRAGKIMAQLQTLARAGLEMHTQVVLCPGFNDGLELERTMDDLGQLWPSVRSLAVVPVGLTGYRQGLYRLSPYNREQARVVLEQVHRRQELFQAMYGDPLVFASDEFYLVAQREVPPATAYGDFPQLENGVGLVRQFLDEWTMAARRLPARVPRSMQCSVVTGTLAGALWKPLLNKLNAIHGLQVQLHILENITFGKTVTVAGLLAGRDLLAGLEGAALGDRLYLPAVMLRDGEQLFLDDLTLQQLTAHLKVPVVPVPGPAAMVADLLDCMQRNI